MNLVLSLLIIALWLYFILLIGRLVLDYIQMFARSWRPSGPVLVVAEIIYTATDPRWSSRSGASDRVPPADRRSLRPSVSGPAVSS